MKPQRSFVAERAVAQHCAELLRIGPGPDEMLPLLGKMGERLARAMAVSLAPLLGGTTPQVRCSAPSHTDSAALAGTIAPLAANSLLAFGRDEDAMLASIEAGAVLRLIDRAFGGKGAAPDPLPTEFPLSTEIMIARLEALLCAGIAEVLGDRPLIRPLRRDGSLALLEPFTDTTSLVGLALEVEEAGQTPWTITLALPIASLPTLLRPDQQARNAPSTIIPADPAGTPFAALPLELTAVLVDMRISLSAIAAIEPGTVLPVSVARNVPLRIGGTTVASGTVGAADDRVAIQITSVS